nr:armadillo repeat-containing protein 12-like [Anser cygnoides]
MAACWGTWTGRRVLSVATGAGAVYLLYRTVAEALSSVPGGTDRYRLESPDHQDGLPVEEVLSRRVCEELLEMLRAQQDGRSRSAILRSITRCVYLMDTKVKGAAGTARGQPPVLRVAAVPIPIPIPIPIPLQLHPTL